MIYGARGKFSRLAPPPPLRPHLPPSLLKTAGPLPVRKNIFYGLAVFAKIGLYIFFNIFFLLM